MTRETLHLGQDRPPPPRRAARPSPGALVALALLAGGCAAGGAASEVGPVGEAGARGGPTLLPYPETPRQSHVEVLHGEPVSDPYRWLEDDRAPETEAWVQAQNEVTFRYLSEIPERDAIRTRLTQLWDYERYGVPFSEGGRTFFTKNDGLQNQSVLYWAESVDGPARVLLDPNALSEDGTTALTSIAVSEDGRYLAYGLAQAGSDWNEWRVREVETGRDLDDVLRWVKFSGAAWSPDGEGFYYARYPEPEAGAEGTGQNLNQSLYYHRLGTPQSEDRLVLSNPDEPKWGFSPEVSEDGRLLVVSIWKGTGEQNLVYVAPLVSSEQGVREGPWQKLVDRWFAEMSFVGNDGDVLWFKTDHEAPRGRVVAVDLARPEPWREVIPQAQHSLSAVSVVGDRFFARYLADAKTQVRVYELSGAPAGEVELPGIGTARGFSGERADGETFYSFTGFSTPGTIFRLDVQSLRSRVLWKPDVAFDPERYVTEQVFFTSKDGTRVPMFVSHRKDLLRDGDRPTLLYGYGGFNISLTPTFSVSSLVWMERGGVYAVPNLRGGGEYGKEWHEAGTRHHKQNVFDDFIAAAEFLIEAGITRPERLAIRGGSNGGLLVGAFMTQRPDLAAAAIPQVGVMDMLRFHRFTIGWAWVDDYGSPDDPSEFQTLLAYSPYHNLRPGVRYPSTLITTADHDDRVVPAHSFKFAAALQRAHAGANPVLIRIQTQAGHGAGKPTAMRIAEEADILAFLTQVLRGDAPQRAGMKMSTVGWLP